MTCLKGAQPVEALDEATRIFESIILKSTIYPTLKSFDG